MTIPKYAFDVHAAGDETGALLVRLSPDDNLVSGEYTHVGFGLGEGVLRIHADHADATTENFTRRNYVRFVRVDTDPEQHIGGFFLEEGDFAALSRREAGGRILTFRGPGGLAILDRYVLGQAIYAPGQTARGSHDEPGKWTWEGVSYGGILTRAIEEGQFNDDALPAPPFNAVTLGFTRTRDSNEELWQDVTDYQVDIGTSVLELYMDVLRHGIVVQADADLMISAYRMKSEFGVDRTGGAFGAGVARFEAGVNIAGEIPKRIHASSERSHVLTRRKDGLYQTFGSGYPGGVVGSGVPYFDFIEVPQTSDPDAIARIAEAHLERLSAYVDQATVRHVIGEGVGQYAPGPAGDYWVLDLATVHTGTGDQDFDEAPIEVASIRFHHDDAGNWLAETELGAEYIPPEVAEFRDRIVTQVRQAGTLSRCATVQVEDVGDITVVAEAYYSAGGGANVTGTLPAGYDDGDHVAIAHGFYDGGLSGAGDGIPDPPAGWTAIGSGGFSGGASSGVGQHGAFRVLQPGDDDIGTWSSPITGVKLIILAGMDTSDPIGAIASGTQPSGQMSWDAIAVPERTDGSSRFLAVGVHESENIADNAMSGTDTDPLTAGSGGLHAFWLSDPLAAWAAHTLSCTDDDRLETTYELRAAPAGAITRAGLDSRLAGSDEDVPYCDHAHLIVSDEAPTVSEDQEHGIPAGTLWVRVDDLDTPTEVAAVYVSVDDTDGAAVWLEFPAGSGSSSFVGARAYNSTTQNISNGSGDTHTVATLNSEEFDTDGFHSTVTNTGRMTVPSGKAGKYRVRGHAFFEANATGIRSCCIMKNGTKHRGSATRTLVPGSTGGISVWAEATLDLAVGDYVELGVYQTSGGTRTIGHASLLEIQTVLEIEYLGA